MATIIDSLFLELGIDTSKFSADQQRALAKIAEFESKTKRATGKSAEGVKTVGKAFHDLASDSALGGASKKIDTLAAKLKTLGTAAQVSGGVGAPLGALSKGLGMLLSPSSLGVAALGLLGKTIWDVDAAMTASNATLARQAQLSGVAADKLWAWGQAGKAVGGAATDIPSGITGLQTAVQGMMIGAADATPQLVQLARLGVRWNPQSGVDVTSLFERVHAVGKTQGWARARALSSGLMNDTEFNLAMKDDWRSELGRVGKMAPADLGKILSSAIALQEKQGNASAAGAGVMERVYGATGNVFAAMAAGIQEAAGFLSSILDVLRHPLKALHHAESAVTAYSTSTQAAQDAANAAPGTLAGQGFGLGESIGRHVRGWFAPTSGATQAREAQAMRALIAQGHSPTEAAAIVGSLMQESGLDPFATPDNGAHRGIAQWDRTRQAAFAKWAGYQMGSPSVPEDQQLRDQLSFVQVELATTQQRAWRDMVASFGLFGKTSAFMGDFEKPGDASLWKRVGYAEEALKGFTAMLTMATTRARAGNTTVTHHTRIGEVNVVTQATDAKGMAAGASKALSTHPLLGPLATQTVTLATRGSQ